MPEPSARDPGGELRRKVGQLDKRWRPFLAMSWGSTGIDSQAYDSILVALARMAGSDQQAGLVAIYLLDLDTLRPICQFADPDAEDYYETVDHAHACRRAITRAHERGNR